MSIIQGGGVIYVSDDKNESFSSLLPRYYIALTDKIHALRIINAMSSNMFDDFLSLTKDKFDKKVESSLSPEEKIEYLFKMGRGILAPVGWGYKTENPKISKLLDEETEMYHNREDIRRALKEMMLVYLVIIFEEFLTNVLSALFRKRHDVFRSSGKSIEYVEVLEHSDIYELVKTMSKNEAKDVVESGIVILNKYLKKRFHLYLDKRDDWRDFKEIFHRRNIVVHNYGVPDTIYIKETKSQRKFKGKKVDWLEINDQYIDKAFDMFGSYSHDIMHFFGEKYGQKKSKTKQEKTR